MDEREGLEVGAASRASGITVRTLHHYDRIGLLVPSDRSRAGYRRYSQADLDRLRRILCYRELGFGLDRIAGLLSGADRTAELRRQRELVAERIERLRRIAAALDVELEAHTMGISLTPEEKFELFGPSWSDDHEAEAQQRWGDSGAWPQSQARTAQYTPEQWRELRAAAEQIERAFARLLADAVPADSEPALNLAEAHRQHIITWFNDVPYDLHRGLAQLYVGVARFSAYYDRIAPGLARYVSDAILANADRQPSGG